MIEEYPWLRETYQSLQKSIKEHKSSHALLIQGDNGIGRLVLAKTLSNTFLGFHETDDSEAKDEIIITSLMNEKSKTKRVIGIDQIKLLKKSLLLTSLKGKGKVGIIYQAERMTGDAFGSLLKILEEPPKDTMIILVAESSGKLPKTIVSRSQIINCMHPSHKESMRWLMAREDNDWDPVLSIFGNRPLLIDEMGSEYLENQINALSSEITGLIEGEIKPSEISWKNEDIEINLRILYSWIFKYLEIRLLQGNVDQNLPIGLSRMLDKNVNYESCFKLIDEITKLKELNYIGRALVWDMHVTKLLNPLFIEMSGMKEYV